MSSPRPWGCFRGGHRERGGLTVFPTPVGVFPFFCSGVSLIFRLPHARGGVSVGTQLRERGRQSSPRPWGCFMMMPSTGGRMTVFPTPVGVFPPTCRRPATPNGLPHARGGVSAVHGGQVRLHWSSPRPWGCFLVHIETGESFMVFPTPVGVFLFLRRRAGSPAGLPHARGGVSWQHHMPHRHQASSPRPWGCFSGQGLLRGSRRVFPTPVGVFLLGSGDAPGGAGLPHARGGVSQDKDCCGVRGGSSPRPWGCFHGDKPYPHHHHVFPTPVGVFPLKPRKRKDEKSLPHARGGVSLWAQHASARDASSPRPWGCFPLQISSAGQPGVFPTPVGVFPLEEVRTAMQRSLPHARGGVSFAAAAPFHNYPSSPRPWGCFLHNFFEAQGWQVFPTPVGVFPSAH